MTSKSCKRAKAALSQLPSAVPAAACLNPFSGGGLLQVASGQDDEVVKVWRRVHMPLPARGTAAAQALRNQKQWQTSLTLWQQALSQARQRRLSYRLYQNARRCPRRRGAQRSASLVAEQASVAHLQTLSYVYLRLGKAGTSCWWTRRSSIVIRKTNRAGQPDGDRPATD